MKIFLINSNQLECNVIADFVRDLGHSVSTLHNTEAREKMPDLPAKTADLLIVGVPGKGDAGLSYVDQVAELFPETPMILLGECGFSVPKENPLSRRLHAMLRRPLQLEELDLLLSRFQENVTNEEIQLESASGATSQVQNSNKNDGVNTGNAGNTNS